MGNTLLLILLLASLASANYWSLNVSTNAGPSERRSSVAVAINSTHFAIHAGGAYVDPYGDLWIFDTVNLLWTRRTSTTAAYLTWSLSGVLMRNGTSDVLVFWGGINTPTPIRVYSLDQDSWTILPLPAVRPAARYSHIAVTKDPNTMIISGGSRTDTSFFSDTWMYTLNTNTWIQLNTTNDPPAWTEGRGAYVSSKNLVILAFQAANINTTELWALNLTDNHWTKISQEFIQVGKYPAGVLVRDRYFVLWGGTLNGRASNSTVILDTETFTWQTVFPNCSKLPKVTVNETTPLGMWGGCLIWSEATQKIIQWSGRNDDGVRTWGKEINVLTVAEVLPVPTSSPTSATAVRTTAVQTTPVTSEETKENAGHIAAPVIAFIAASLLVNLM